MIILLYSGYEYEDLKAELMLNVDKIIDYIEWFQDNHMEVNPDKFQCSVFGKVVNPGTFLINGNVVRLEERVTLLGVHIDNKLNFGHHVSHICQKAGKQVKVLGRLSRVINASKMLLLYNSFITFYFNYCCVYGISAIPLILLQYKYCKRRLFDILCLISKVHINSYCITVESLLYF